MEPRLLQRYRRVVLGDIGHQLELFLLREQLRFTRLLFGLILDQEVNFYLTIVACFVSF